MRIALVLTPPTDQHFRWAAQIGVTDYVARYGVVDTAQKLRDECERAAAFGLRLSVVEGYLPLSAVIRGGAQRDAQIERVQHLIEAMGHNGVEILCYNWMPNDDWTRTNFEIPTRGGALTNEFNLADLPDPTTTDVDASNVDAPDAIASDAPDPTTPIPTVTVPTSTTAHRLSASQLWENLDYFLQAVLPVAEQAGVKLAMHPDDPPLRTLLGSAQIMHEPEDFDRLFQLHPGPANGMCLCAGVFSSLGRDIPALIQRFASRIHYAHFRDVQGTVPHFVETFHDAGQQNMPALMRAFHAIGYQAPMRPDHVPKLNGETPRADGYTMLARLFAVGYMRGLMHAIESE